MEEELDEEEEDWTFPDDPDNLDNEPGTCLNRSFPKAGKQLAVDLRKKNQIHHSVIQRLLPNSLVSTLIGDCLLDELKLNKFFMQIG